MIDNPAQAKRGDIVDVTVVVITSDSIMVSTDLKHDGEIPTSDFTERELKALKPGATLKVMALRGGKDGLYIFSKKAAEKEENWEMVYKTYKDKAPILVDFKKRGEHFIFWGKQPRKKKMVQGYWGKYLEFEVFISDYDVSKETSRKNKDLVGLKLPVKVVGLQRREKVIIASERLFMMEEQYKKRSELLESLDIGVIVEGRVIKSSPKEKAFIVDLGGVIGKLKYENVSWDRYQNPREIIEHREDVKLVVIDFNKEDKEVWLSLKDLTDDPWEDIEDKFRIGEVVEGAVYRIFDFGTVINLSDEFRALIPNDELTLTRIVRNPSEMVSVGETLKGIVKRIDIDNRKIIVSVRDYVLEKYNVGDVVKGKVVKVEKYGAFIELEPGVTGLLKVEDISWSQKFRNAKQMIKEGEIVEAKILAIDSRKRQIDFGVKQILPNPWDEIEEKFPVGSKVTGKIVKIIDAGAFVNLDENFDAFLHFSKVPSDEGQDWKEKISVDQEVEGTIIHINVRDKRIQISLMKEEHIETKRAEKADVKSYMDASDSSEEEVTMGDTMSEELFAALKQKAEQKSDAPADKKKAKKEKKAIVEEVKEEEKEEIAEEVKEEVKEEEKEEIAEEVKEEVKEEETKEDVKEEEKEEEVKEEVKEEEVKEEVKEEETKEDEKEEEKEEEETKEDEKEEEKEEEGEKEE
ncbi:S1 RNA-binding domain-containing protein [bacterium]|nr:S1 RNA-binding domain-containing protein [bacterium]